MGRGRKRQVSGQKAAGIKRRVMEEETTKLAPLCPEITLPSVHKLVNAKQVQEATSQEERIESANFTGPSTMENAPPPEASYSLFEVKTEHEVIDITDEPPQPYRCVLCEVPVAESDSLDNLTDLCEERTGGHITHFVLRTFWKLNEDQIQQRLQQGSLSDFMWCCAKCFEKVRCDLINTIQANGTMANDRGCSVPEHCNNRAGCSHQDEFQSSSSQAAGNLTVDGAKLDHEGAAYHIPCSESPIENESAPASGYSSGTSLYPETEHHAANVPETGNSIAGLIPERLSPDSERVPFPWSHQCPRSVNGLITCTSCPSWARLKGQQYAKHIDFHNAHPYQCAVCKNFFAGIDTASHSPLSDKNHKCVYNLVSVHFQSNYPWCCQFCAGAFSSEQARDVHEDQQHHGQKHHLEANLSASIHFCRFCAKGFRNVEERNIHRSINHPDHAAVSCEYCEEEFVMEMIAGERLLDTDQLTEHMMKIHGSLFSRAKHMLECYLCGFPYTTGKRISDHFAEVHGSRDNSWCCPVHLCSLKFGTCHQLKAHVNTHHKVHLPNVCEVCTLEFSDKRKFYEHQLKLHGKDPPFNMTLLCLVHGCEFRTVIQATLDKHMAEVHCIQNDHECGICRKRFKNKRGLRQHLGIHNKPAAQSRSVDV